MDHALHRFSLPRKQLIGARSILNDYGFLRVHRSALVHPADVSLHRQDSLQGNPLISLNSSEGAIRRPRWREIQDAP